MFRRLVVLLAGLTLALGLTACSDDDPTEATDTPSGDAAGFPVTIGDLTIEEEPTRIISLSATATETLFAIGAGDQVVAVDDQSDFPEGVPTTDLSGFTPNIEAIAGYEPDLVILTTNEDDVIGSLGNLDIPVLVHDVAVELDDMYEQIEQLGQVTGHVDEATELADDIESELAEIVDDVGDDAEGLTYYYELDETYFSVTSNTFIGQLIGLLGMENIADEGAEADDDYVQLSAEFIVDTDPDLILLSDAEFLTQPVEARAGWETLTAISGAGVVELDADIASRWGPRVVDLLRTVANAATEVAAAA